LSSGLHQEAVDAGELILLLRKNDHFKLFVYYVRNREAVSVIGVVVGERRF
jgi:hypothetical protein